MNLQAAIDAVREESVERGAAESMTRHRVLASIERSPSRRLHAVVAAVIASMFGASAFAWYARAPEPAVAPAITHEAVAVAVAEPIIGPDRVAVHIATDEQAMTVEPVPVAIAVPAKAKATPAPIAEPVVVAKPNAGASAPTPAAQPDPELALYATAHHLHFQQHDMAAAIGAWDRYLAAAPAGKLAPEARFNRLVALVKLERWDDAARALVGFDDPAFRPADLAKLRTLISSHRPR